LPVWPSVARPQVRIRLQLWQDSVQPLQVCLVLCVVKCINIVLCVNVCPHVCTLSQCMYVCMYGWMYVCMYYVCLYVCMYVWKDGFMYVCMYVCSMYVLCLSVCMYVCMYVCKILCKYPLFSWYAGLPSRTRRPLARSSASTPLRDAVCARKGSFSVIRSRDGQTDRHPSILTRVDKIAFDVEEVFFIV
jgi:hypothetical protein